MYSIAIDFALYLTKRGYCDRAVGRFATAIRSQIEAACSDLLLINSWGVGFDLVVLDFLCEMFKSIAFLSDEKCEVLSRDTDVRAIWLQAYTIFCITIR